MKIFLNCRKTVRYDVKPNQNFSPPNFQFVIDISLKYFFVDQMACLRILR